MKLILIVVVPSVQNVTTQWLAKLIATVSVTFAKDKKCVRKCPIFVNLKHGKLISLQPLNHVMTELRIKMRLMLTAVESSVQNVIIQ